MGKHVKKMEDGDYTIEPFHKVTWSGEAHESWCAIANQLGVQETLSILCAAQASTQPHGAGARLLDGALKDAAFAIATNCGRQTSLEELGESGPVTRGQQMACDILLEAKRLAARHGASVLGMLRLLCSVRSHGQQNGPHDSYMRLCVGALKQY